MATFSSKAYAKIAYRVFNFIVLISLCLSNLAFPKMNVNAADIKTDENPYTKVDESGSTYSPPKYTHPQARTISRSNNIDLSAEKKISSTESVGGIPVMFIENIGQFDSPERFDVHGSNGAMQILSDSIEITLSEPPPSPMIYDDLNHTEAPVASPTPSPDSVEKKEKKVSNVRLTFDGANPNTSIVGFNRLNTKVSIYKGNNPENWRSDVPAWGGVRYLNIYDGIDLELTSDNSQWIWRFSKNITIIKDRDAFLDEKSESFSDSSPSNKEIRLKIEGSDQISIAGNNINISTELGNIQLPLPQKAFSDSSNESDMEQNSKEVQIDGNEVILPFSLPGSSEIYENNISPSSKNTQPNITLGEKNKDHGVAHLASPAPLSKDNENLANYIQQNQDYNEVPFFSTYLGTTLRNVVVDSAGNTILLGPVTVGDNIDLGVYKLNASGSDLISLNTYGGDQTDFHWDCVVDIDVSDNIYILGTTRSGDFPISANAFDKVFKGASEAYFINVSSGYISYLGGKSDDIGHGIAVGSASEVYVTGMTASNDFPIVGGFDSLFEGGQEAFVSIIDSSGLIYSTYIGGDDADQGHGIAVQNGNAYVTGQTLSSDFPGSGAYGGGWDSFVLKLNQSGLVYSRFLGGSGDDCERVGDFRECAIAVSKNGDAYVTGMTNSSDFPSLHAYDTSTDGSDAYLARFSASGDLIFSTYVGGSSGDAGFGIVVNDFGVVYLTGYTASSNFPTTTNGYDRSISGTDVFLSIFGPEGYPPIYSTYLGGSLTDIGYDLAINENDMVYLTGETDSSNFPHSTNAYLSSCGGDCGFVTAFYLPNMTAIANDQINDKCPIPEECPENNAVESTSSVADPINTSTGQFYYNNQDISIPLPSQSLTFARSYSAFTTDMYTTTMGYGWTHSLDTHLILPDDQLGYDGYIRFKAHSTNIYDFKRQDNGSYEPMPGVVGVLTYTSTIPYTYTLVMPSQTTYTFDYDGILHTIENSTGQKTIYSYNQNDQLTRVTDESNTRFLDLSYNGEGFVSNVSDQSSREITFTYNISDDLVSYLDVLGQTWQYEYDNNHNMTKIIDPDVNTIAETEYDSSGRAIKQWDGLGNQVVDITFNGNGSVTVEDPLDNMQTHVYDGRGTLIGDVIGTGITTTKQYDRNFNPIKITGPTGQETQMEWSEDGVNLTSIEDAVGNTTEITYDDLNNPTEVIDALNHVTTYDYDGKLLTHATDALDEVITYTYTEEGYLESVTNPLTQTTTYAYDEFGQRTSVTNTLGIATTYEYDDLGRVINTTDALGRVTHTDYDAAGRVVKSIRNYDPARPQNDENQYNIVTTYVYDVRGYQIAVTDTYSRTNQYIYNDAGLLVNTIDPLGYTITNTYNEAGQLITVTNAFGYSTVYTYDEAGRQTAVTDALGHSTQTLYNLDGTIANSIDTLGHEITYTYDSLGRLITTTNELNSVTTSEYDALGNVITSTNALGDATTYEYDALGRLIKQIDPLDGETEYFYDEVGNRIQTIDPRDHATTYTYDDANRLVKVTDALGSETQYEYDDLGRQAAIIDDEGNRTEYSYDSLDRVIAVTDPLSRTTTTEYDALGNVLSVTDANDNTTSYVYDDLYRQIQQTNALSGTTSYTYDALGNRLTSTDENGHATTFQYDALGRNISVTDPISNTTSTFFNAAGQVISTTNALGKTTSFEYDALGRQISITDPNGSVTEQSYDAAGNLISITDPNDVVTNYEYDESGHLTAVVENFKPGYSADNETNVRTEYTYDANGNRLTIKDANNHTTSFVYDELNRVIEESDPLENTWTFTYDSLGRKATVTDANEVTATYIYDDSGQLTGIDFPGSTSDVSFTYDSGGRRTQMVDSLGTTTWNYDDLNRIISITDPFTQTVGYNYDSAGNRTGITYPDTKNVSYTYNSANQLTNVTDWDEQVTQYTYDPVGRLLSILRPNEVDTSYTYNDGGHLTQLQHTYESSELAKYQYIYDSAGNRTSAIEYYKNVNKFDAIFFDDFESGDLLEWSSASIDEGDLSVTTEAKLEGDFGLQAVIDDINDIFVQDSLPDNEVNYNQRFYFDPNSVYLPVGSSMDIFRAYDVNSVLIYYISMRPSLGDEYQIQISVLDDSQQVISSLWIPITDETHAIEIDWRAASEAGANDGETTIWLDGNQKEILSDIDNDGKSIDYIQMGVLSPSTTSIAGTVFFDDFFSINIEYIGLNLNIQPPEIPDGVLSDAFESGDFSAWTDVVTDSNDLAVTSADVIEGSYSMQASVNDQTDIYVLDSNPLGDTNYHARFYFDPNAITIPSEAYVDLFQSLDMTSSQANFVRLRSLDGQYQIQAGAVDDNQQTYNTSWINISDERHAIEIEWQSSTGSSANDGSLNIWIDGGKKGNLFNLENYTKRIDAVKFGALSISDSSIAGSILYDDFVSNRTGYIGLNYDIYLPYVFDDAFESGDFYAWSDVITDSGDLTITGVAPIEGNYSLKAVVNDANDLWVEDNSPYYDYHYYARFYFDPYSISIPENEYVTIFQGIDENTNPVLYVRLQELDECFQVQAVAIDDDQSEWQSDWISLDDGINMIEFEWYKSWGSEAYDGFFDLWVNDANNVGMSGLDNDTKFIDKIELGVFSPSTTTVTGAVFFDDFDSNRDNWLGQNPEVSLLPESQIFADNFETGEPARWDEALTGNGDLSVSAQAAILGNYGLQAVIDDNEEIYLTDLNPDSNYYDYLSLFYFDPNSVSIPSGETVNIYQLKDETDATVLTLQLRQVYGEYQIRASTLDDNTQTTYSRWFAITDEAHAIGIYWFTALEAEANNGFLNIYLDDAQVWTINSLDNDTRFVDIAQLGVISPTTSTISGTIFFDDYDSDDWDYIYINPNFTIPELPEDIFEDDFESGDFSAWSTVITDTGNLIVTSTAALEGNYGMLAAIDDQNELYVYDESPWGNTYYQVRFAFDPNSVAIPQDETIDIFHANDATTGLVYRVRLRLVSGQYQVAAAVEDDSAQVIESAYYDIDDAPVSIQLEFATASEWDSYNGHIKLWLDDEYKEEVYDIDNFTKRVDNIQLGVMSPSTSTITGAVYFDDLDSNRTGYIGYQLQDRIMAAFDLRQWLRRAGEFISGMFELLYTGQVMQTPDDKAEVSSLSPLTITGDQDESLSEKAEPALSGKSVLANYVLPNLPQTTLSAPLASSYQKTMSHTITYSYDPLSRLTAADYSDNTYYHYTYDAVGNRLSQVTNSSSITYTYDIANRLTNTNGATYTWDANGNLLSDGINTYTYDLANRLTAFDDGTNTTTYAYNGLGDRLQQTVNYTTTTYAVDIAGGLTQVLSDGTNTYLYGAGRIAQKHNSITEYYLDDALGSVRQLANSGGEVVLARAYDPYGNLVENIAYDGVTTAYGYAGEFTDTSGMVYLRARYYSPAQGRFVSRDVWEGDYNNPLSLNRWGYVEGNPINYTDPSGYSLRFYYYNREKAANYAMDWDQQPGLDPEYDFSGTSTYSLSEDCTHFASSVLYEGGVRDPREDPKPSATGKSDYDIPYWDINILKIKNWDRIYGYKGETWFITPPFYEFATHIIHGSVYTYQNPPQYISESVYGNGNIDENWEKWLSTLRSTIQKGDLVFYKQEGDAWGHVAVVVGWGAPTSFGGFNDNLPSGTNEDLLENLQDKCYDPSTEPPSHPLVVERNGKIAYTDYRSLDNTKDTVQTISIVHLKDYGQFYWR